MNLALPVKDLRIIRDFPAEEFCQRYLDVFMLSFYLIGINIGDLLLLRPTDMVGGRIEFSRQKTKKRYSIKVEPEAQEIINRWRGKKYLLCFMDERADYRSFLKMMNKHLKEFGRVEVDKARWGKKRKPASTLFCDRIMRATRGRRWPRFSMFRKIRSLLLLVTVKKT